ncbi:MAG: serine hydrolase domain-containing protein [Acidobacteriota bacterium]
MSPRIRVPAALAVAVLSMQVGTGAQALAVSLFERYLEPLRVQAGIPGLSAAIVQDGQVIWERGFGLADLDRALPARPDTPYHIGDVTQTVSTILLARCAEQGTVQPDDPLQRWIPDAPDPPATLRQVLSHTSGSTGAFKYDPARFALVTGVVTSCARQVYRQVMARSILDRLAMIDAVPGRDLPTITPGVDPVFDQPALDRYGATLSRLATPYKVDRRGRAAKADPAPGTIDAASGLIASVRDLAKYDAALDSGVLIRADSLAQVWTNTVANGVVAPTTMGWFAQNFEGHRLVWSFGLIPDAYSALLLKVPARRLTVILLANSDGLSVPFSLHDGDVATSLFARTFLRLFL